MATSAALLRKRALATGPRAKKLGATRLADAPTRRPFADLTNGGCDEPQLAHDASPSRSPPCMSVPPPASPVAPQHAYFVGDTETFFEPHAQLRLPRALLAAERKDAAGPSWASNLSGVLAQLHSKAALLLAEEALPAAPPDGEGVLGSGLLAMNHVATVVGTALDSFVEGGLDSLGVTHALPPPGALSPAGACSGAPTPPPPASAAATWGGFEDTPFSPPRPACRSAAAAAPVRAGPHDPPAPCEAEDLAVVREQLQLLLAEKARLAQANARLERENKDLRELLSVLTCAEEEAEEAEEEAGEEGEDCDERAEQVQEQEPPADASLHGLPV